MTPFSFHNIPVSLVCKPWRSSVASGPDNRTNPRPINLVHLGPLCVPVSGLEFTLPVWYPSLFSFCRVAAGSDNCSAWQEPQWLRQHAEFLCRKTFRMFLRRYAVAMVIWNCKVETTNIKKKKKFTEATFMLLLLVFALLPSEISNFRHFDFVIDAPNKVTMIKLGTRASSRPRPISFHAFLSFSQIYPEMLYFWKLKWSW